MDPDRAESEMDLSHLRRETRSALELAVVALASTEVVDRLATVAGLLDALVELPKNSAPVVALVPRVTVLARGALADWQAWQHEHLEKRMPQG